MALEFRHEDGSPCGEGAIACPNFICDECHNPIRNAADAIVVFRRTPTNQAGSIWFCHNGVCAIALEHRVENPGHIDLVLFISQLTRNTGVSPEAITARLAKIN
jgi:hypothetical protein